MALRCAPLRQPGGLVGGGDTGAAGRGAGGCSRRANLRLLPVRAGAAPGGPTQEDNLLVRWSVGALTEALRLAGVGRAEYEQLAGEAVPVQRLPPGDVAGVMAAIRRDFELRAYFVTGVIEDAIYAEDCLFADPTVSFRGLQKWKRNLQLLVPFLDGPRVRLLTLERLPPAPCDAARAGSAAASVRLPAAAAAMASSGSAELPTRSTAADALPSQAAAVAGGQTGADALQSHERVQSAGSSGATATNVVRLKATWTLQTHLKLPWRPYIDIVGATEYTLNEDANQVVRHVESWNVSGLQALGQIVRPGGNKQG